MMDNKVKKLKPVDAAYIAALIDGEGTVTLMRAHKDEYRQVHVSINNSDKKMLEWVLTTVGAGKIVPKKVYSDKHTQTFTYRIVAQKAFPLLEQIFPYLHTYKKERAKLILKYADKLTVRNGKYSKELLKKKIEFIKRFFKLNPTKISRLLDFI